MPFRTKFLTIYAYHEHCGSCLGTKNRHKCKRSHCHVQSLSFHTIFTQLILQWLCRPWTVWSTQMLWLDKLCSFQPYNRRFSEVRVVRMRVTWVSPRLSNSPPLLFIEHSGYLCPTPAITIACDLSPLLARSRISQGHWGLF